MTGVPALSGGARLVPEAGSAARLRTAALPGESFAKGPGSTTYACMTSVVHTWLRENTFENEGMAYRTTRAIASWTKLPEDRVRYICSIDERIHLSASDREGVLTLHEVRDRLHR